MVVDPFRCTPPASAGIAKAPNEFLFLGVYADNGQVQLDGSRAKGGNKRKLPVTVWVCRSRQLFVIDPQCVSLGLE